MGIGMGMGMGRQRSKAKKIQKRKKVKTVRKATSSPTRDGGDEFDLVSLLKWGAGVVSFGDKGLVQRGSEGRRDAIKLNGRGQGAVGRQGVGFSVDQNVNRHGKELIKKVQHAVVKPARAARLRQEHFKSKGFGERKTLRVHPLKRTVKHGRSDQKAMSIQAIEFHDTRAAQVHAG